MSKDETKYTYAEILDNVEAHAIEARRICVVPVLLQDKTKTAEEREALAQLSIELTNIENLIAELRQKI